MAGAKKPPRDRNFIAEAISDVGSLSIVVAWTPGKSNPLSIDYLVVNGQKRAEDVKDFDSPFVRSRIQPTADGKVYLGWKVTAEVSIEGLAIVLTNTANGQHVVAETAGPLARGEQWSGNKKVTPP